MEEVESGQASTFEKSFSTSNWTLEVKKIMYYVVAAKKMFSWINWPLREVAFGHLSKLEINEVIF